MPFDAQGNFTRVMNWQEDAANDIAILASRHDAEDDNFAAGFNNTVCRDGRGAMTGALKMGNNKITGVANGTAANDVVNKSQLDGKQATITGAASTIVSGNFSEANQNKVLYSASTGKVGVYPSFDVSKLLYLASLTGDVQSALNNLNTKATMTTGSVNRTINGNTYRQYYIKFSNGFQICAGKTETTGANDTVINFANSFTTVWGGTVSMIEADNSGYAAYIHSLSTTGIAVHRLNNNSGTVCSYIVIGTKS